MRVVPVYLFIQYLKRVARLAAIASLFKTNIYTYIHNIQDTKSHIQKCL